MPALCCVELAALPLRERINRIQVNSCCGRPRTSLLSLLLAGVFFALSFPLVVGFPVASFVVRLRSSNTDCNGKNVARLANGIQRRRDLDIYNHYRLTDSIASSGQPLEDQFKDIAEAGYDAVINLAMPDSDHAIPTEGSIVTSLGMTYIHIPVPFDAPSEGHFAAFSGYMDTLQKKKVWVHCVVNARVSAFLFR